jgi:3-hydroxy acid dehydrogenase / malonic semialdehyde reductase
MQQQHTALITGASAGIGEACARAFAQAGARLILTARRADRLEALQRELSDRHGTHSHVLELDVRDAGVVSRLLGDLPRAWSGVTVLVNNAGLALGQASLAEGELRDWDEMIDTNVKGLLYVTRALLPGMVERGRGHVINIGSIVGSDVAARAGVYSATKSAVETITRGLRIDLFGTPIRVSIVYPGLVETEFSTVRFGGDQERAARVYQGFQPLRAEDVADAVLYVATRPPHVNIDELVVKPTAQARVGMVHREKAG